MLNFTVSRARATDTGARVRAIDNLRRFADRVAAAAASREPMRPVRPARTDEPAFWILHAR